MVGFLDKLIYGNL